MKLLACIIILAPLTWSCSIAYNQKENDLRTTTLEFGGDFSIMKKMEDFGGLYKMDGVVKKGFLIFKDNGYSWARLRIFHTPNMRGPVCNDLKTTIILAKKAKQFGFKVLLDIHYSDTWADPGHQIAPSAWKGLSQDILKDSIYNYTKKVIETMGNAGVLPEMVQVGNEINNGMVWPTGKLWLDGGVVHWDALTELIKAGINGVKDAKNASYIPIMIHAATGGDINASTKFYTNIIERGADFDVIGLSYYPWWHGSFDELEKNIRFLSRKFTQDISIVETAYYSNNWYPEPSQWVLSDQPYPATELGQYNFLFKLAERLNKIPKVNSVFYWKPDGLDIPKSKVNYLGRSLFDHEGNALMGISAWKDYND